jgi:hypothetical protein
LLPPIDTTHIPKHNIFNTKTNIDN